MPRGYSLFVSLKKYLTFLISVRYAEKGGGVRVGRPHTYSDYGADRSSCRYRLLLLSMNGR
jgi:hypothetical protein